MLWREFYSTTMTQASSVLFHSGLPSWAVSTALQLSGNLPLFRLSLMTAWKSASISGQNNLSLQIGHLFPVLCRLPCLSLPMLSLNRHRHLPLQSPAIQFFIQFHHSLVDFCIIRQKCTLLRTQNMYPSFLAILPFQIKKKNNLEDTSIHSMFLKRDLIRAPCAIKSKISANSLFFLFKISISS